MPRTKTGVVRRQGHKKVLKLAKGFRMTRNRLYKVASEAVLHAGQYAFAGRRQKKRQFRTTWIKRITAALSATSTNYSTLVKNMKSKGVILNRKVISELAIKFPKTFDAIVAFTNSK